MKSGYRWYEKLFFRVCYREKFWLRLVCWLILTLVILQSLLSLDSVRRILVLTERLEGKPVKFYKSLNP